MINRSVLYVSFDQFGAGKGAAVHIAKFAEAISSRYSLTLITPYAGERDQEHPVSAQRAYRHLEFGLPGGNLLARVEIFRKKLLDHLSQNRYRIVQFRSIWEGRALLDGREGTELIYEANGFPSIELKYHYPRLTDNQALLTKLRQQELALLLAARRIITPASATKKFIEAFGVSSAKIRVIANGADAEFFLPQPNVLNNALDNAPADDVARLIYVGTLAPWQGIEVLLAAFRQALKTRPLILTIIGPARKCWRKHYRRIVDSYKLGATVRFCGPCSQIEIAAQLALADIALAPLLAVDRNILQGCSPIKIFEYAAAGKAIIAADIASVSEIFADRREALLHQPGNPEQICARILELADNEILRNDLGRKARELVAARYTWRQAQAKLLEVYQELLEA